MAKRNANWQKNSRLIGKAMIDFWKDHKQPATNKDIARLTKLSEATISRHFQDTDFEWVFEKQREKMTSLSEPLFMAIFNSALGGNARSQEMLLQVLYNWAKPMSMEHSGEIDVMHGLASVITQAKKLEAKSKREAKSVDPKDVK